MIGRLFLLLALFAAYPARAQLFGAHALDPKWCDARTVRQTAVYVDDTLMFEGETDWVQKLDGKLKASLTPGERVTVVRLSAKSGQSHEEWSGCWPALGGVAAEGGLGSFFTASPAANVGEQQKYFFAGMGGALTRIYQDAKRQKSTTDPASAPAKQLLRALASDDGRFGNTKSVLRAIVYSDMAENSDLGAAYKGRPNPLPNYGVRLGSFLRHGIFYAFGVGDDLSDPQFTENARAFWQAALHTMSASLAGLGTDLNVPNILPTSAGQYKITMDFNSQILTGTMTLLMAADGTLVDSAINIQRLGAVSLTGTFTCDGEKCTLAAQTAQGLATDAAAEDVAMAGARDALSGSLGLARYQFAIKAVAP